MRHRWLKGLANQKQIESRFYYLPETLCHVSAGLNPEEGVLGGGVVELCVLGVGEERVRPPDLLQHLVADTQLPLSIWEVQPLVLPVLTEVHVQREVL